MCGIAGFCSFDRDFLQNSRKWTQVLVDMRTAIAHRGHDQTGEYLRKHVGLAHTRLSIRDLAGGAQPMLRRQDGVEYAIVYNGEIYNAEELKQDLELRGFHFETRSDTEVILCGYMEYGPEIARRLNGIYAFAIWDGGRDTLMLCREPDGGKATFLCRGRRHPWCSAPSPRRCLPIRRFIPGQIWTVSGKFLGVGPARTPGCGVFCGLREVKPAQIVTFSREGP